MWRCCRYSSWRVAACTSLDNFQIQGPNWTHEVFVTEVVASFEWPTSFATIQFTRMWDQTRRILFVWNLLGSFIQFWKSFVHQAFLGVSYYLYIRWIAHGGKHMILLSLSLESSKTNYFRSTTFEQPRLPVLTPCQWTKWTYESDLLPYFGIPERADPCCESGGPDSILRTLPHSHYLDRWVLSKGKTTAILWSWISIAKNTGLWWLYAILQPRLRYH